MAYPVSIIGQNSTPVSFLILNMGNITSDNFKIGRSFLIKNTTDSDITTDVIPNGLTASITTVFYPGWNPEVIKEVVTAVSGLQYGY